MKIHVVNQQTDLPIDEEQVIALTRAVLQNEGAETDELTIHFVNDQDMRLLHDEFFHDSSSTDCISFPIDSIEEEPYRVLGDVFVCPATAIQYGEKHGLQPHEETTLYIVHGLLHLLGYDDIQDEERDKMREAERRNIAMLRSLQLLLHSEEEH